MPHKKSATSVRRLFILEPGLTHFAGHPLECVLSLQAAADRLGITPHVVAPVTAPSAVLSGIRFAHSLLPGPCFPIDDDHASAVSQSLSRLAALYALDHRDLLLLTSSHINELNGIAQFLTEREHTHESPKIAFTVHQLFPPAPLARTVLDSDYQSLWLNQLQDALRRVPIVTGGISYWTAPCEALATACRKAAARHVGTLPFPITLHKSPTASSARRRQRTCLTFAFLGDGREEKGFLILLQALLRIETGTHLRFILQHVNPRGFDDGARNQLDELIAIARRRGDVSVIERQLPPAEFQSLVDETDVAVLPYDPRHYDRRASMVFVIAAMHGVPVVVFDGTWMADQMRDAKADGIICSYEPADAEVNSSVLCDGILRMQQQWERHHARAQQCGHHYRRFHTPDHHLETVLEYHKRSLL